jgi:hypothetical protein
MDLITDEVAFREMVSRQIERDGMRKGAPFLGPKGIYSRYRVCPLCQSVTIYMYDSHWAFCKNCLAYVFRINK